MVGLEARFWAKVDKGAGPDGCWIWTAYVSPQGYGSFDRDLAHRISYRWAHGEIPEGCEIDHTCHNRDTDCWEDSGCPHRRCVNPTHLEAVPHSVNARRGRTGKYARMPKTHCLRGHELTPENTSVNTRGERQCRTCLRARWREATKRKWAKKKAMAS